MFPLTFCFNSGETEIIFIDQDSLTGFLYIADTTSSKELLVSGGIKSVFISMINGIDYIWIKLINSTVIDTVEFMSSMGSSSQNLFLYVTKSISLYITIIFTISKSNGSIVNAVEIIDPSNIGDVNPSSKQNYRF